MPQALQGPIMSDSTAIAIIVALVAILLSIMVYNYAVSRMCQITERERMRNCFSARRELMMLDPARFNNLSDPTFILSDPRYGHLRSHTDWMMYYQSEERIYEATIN